jgi:hypothetical protein
MHLDWHRHPGWAKMRMGMSHLNIWSFLMASAHGAGLMVVPVFLGMTTVSAHGSRQPLTVEAGTTTALPAAHAAGYLLVTALVAFRVFEKLGVALLQKAWFNLDLFCCIALVVSGLATVFLHSGR